MLHFRFPREIYVSDNFFESILLKGADLTSSSMLFSANLGYTPPRAKHLLLVNKFSNWNIFISDTPIYFFCCCSTEKSRQWSSYCIKVNDDAIIVRNNCISCLWKLCCIIHQLCNRDFTNVFLRLIKENQRMQIYVFLGWFGLQSFAII